METEIEEIYHQVAAAQQRHLLLLLLFRPQVDAVH